MGHWGKAYWHSVSVLEGVFAALSDPQQARRHYWPGVRLCAPLAYDFFRFLRRPRLEQLGAQKISLFYRNHYILV